MGIWAGWETDVLTKGKWPVSIENQRFLREWQVYEESACHFNPLNTTLAEPGSSNCNSFTSGGVTYHVQSYPTSGVGAFATVKTLNNGNYPYIVAALKTGDPFTFMQPNEVAKNISKWGTPRYAAAYSLEAGTPSPGFTEGTPDTHGGTSEAPIAQKLTSDHGWNSLMRGMTRTAPTNIAYTRQMNKGLTALSRRHR